MVPLVPADRIWIRGLRTPCIIGIYPNERQNEQILQIDLRLDIDVTPTSLTGDLQRSVDYARVSHEVIALLRFRQYRLLEVACEEIAAMLLGIHSELEGLMVELVKPVALCGNGAPAIAIERRSSDYPKVVSGQARTTSTRLATPFCRIECIDVAPGGTLASGTGERIEWTVEGELACDRGDTHEDVWSPIVTDGEVRYENRRGRRAQLFRCTGKPGAA